MTIEPSIGASSDQVPGQMSWDNILWQKAQKMIERLQTRIAKAIREGRKGKARALQRLLTCSFYGKCLAVKRVVQNKGSKTPGIDGVIWRTSLQKMKAALSLKRKGYKPQPLKRIYIPKRDGRRRPLSIPTMYDRAQQALWKMALEPIAEEGADPNSYGFRPKRSAADALRQCHIVLAQRTAAPWILEADIEACFDHLDWTWLLENIPMDKIILKKFLQAGYMDTKGNQSSTRGSPQGSLISPTLMLMAMSGLERFIKSRIKPKVPSKVHIITYCDDFIITGAHQEILRDKVIPLVKEFLKERGLTLSERKTKITSIKEGFNFLGHHIKRYSHGMVLIKPSPQSIKSCLTELRETVKSLRGATPEVMILNLNPKIRGWCNYFRHAVAKRIFCHIDNQIYHMLSRWAYRRHPNKSKSWCLKKYFKPQGSRQWVFTGELKFKTKEKRKLFLISAQKTPIRRHIKIRGEAHPYNPLYKTYLEQRKENANIWLGNTPVAL